MGLDGILNLKHLEFWGMVHFLNEARKEHQRVAGQEKD